MSVVTDTKQERINLRLKLSSKKMLERAASIEGKTVSSYILMCALENAEKTIHEHEVITLNGRDAETFFNALDRPVRFNKKLTDALEEHDQRVISK